MHLPTNQDDLLLVVFAAVLVGVLGFVFLRSLYQAAFIDPRQRFPDGSPSRMFVRGALNVTLGLLALGIVAYLFRYLVPPAHPLPSPAWLLVPWLLRDWIILLAESCVALVVMRVGVLAWHRLRHRSSAMATTPEDEAGIETGRHFAGPFET